MLSLLKVLSVSAATLHPDVTAPPRAGQRRLVSPSDAFDQQTASKGTRHSAFPQLISESELPAQ